MNFWFLVNPFVALLARSPLHFIISNQVLVIQFKGRKSGKSYLVPVSYHEHESSYTCVTLRSNIWWRNLKDISHTQIWLKGKLTDVQIDLEFNNDQIVENTLRDLVTNNKVDAYFAKIKLNKDGSPNSEDLIKAAKLHTVLKFTIT
jgi:ABC-type molybdate transport system ATPase subunit